MKAHQCVNELPALDMLITRPNEPLPTVLDPKSPRGLPADPKPTPKEEGWVELDANDLAYTA